MSEEKDTDLSGIVPPAAPLIGDPAEPDQPAVDADRVVPPGAAGDDGGFTSDEARRRDDQA